MKKLHKKKEKVWNINSKYFSLNILLNEIIFNYN